MAVSGIAKRVCMASLVNPCTFLRVLFILGMLPVSTDKYLIEVSLLPRYLRKALNEASLLLQVSLLFPRTLFSQPIHSSTNILEKHSADTFAGVILSYLLKIWHKVTM
ncbi:MAG: hypothetical protein LUH50_15530 [Bacteroides intestinalis]|nr:hypothetical protein [Bacteroides intestinalis]